MVTKIFVNIQPHPTPAPLQNPRFDTQARCTLVSLNDGWGLACLLFALYNTVMGFACFGGFVKFCSCQLLHCFKQFPFSPFSGFDFLGCFVLAGFVPLFWV